MSQFRKYILLVPLLLVMISVAGIILLVMGLWEWTLLFLLLAFLINWISETFALNKVGDRTKETGEIRVLTYNVNRAHDFSVNKGTTKELISFIERQDADIVLLQEFNVALYPEIREKLLCHYPYELGTEKGSRFKSVFCKYPIEECEQLSVDADNQQYELLHHAWYCTMRDGEREVLPVCSMVVRIWNKRIRVVNCHLMSNNYSLVIRSIRRNRDVFLKAIMPAIKRMDFGYSIRKLQAELVCNHIRACPENLFIVCGDFNDISGSSTLWPFRKIGLKNAWWEGGCGFGFTFHGMKMRLRLDHVLFSASSIKLKRVFVPHSNCSDHDPLIVDISILDT